MLTTPNANRTHISIYGDTNAGKSSFFNAILGQDFAVVSDVEGTTTDPVIKKMELLPYGPVVFIDTAGLDDVGPLGNLRVEKTIKNLNRTDFSLYLIDSLSLVDNNYQLTDNFQYMMSQFKKRSIDSITILTKKDCLTDNQIEKIQKMYPEFILLSNHELSDIHRFKDLLIEKLSKNQEDPAIVGDLLPYGSTVVLVVPIDSEAPKGRIILPQVQIIRDCLDHGIKTIVVRDTELEETLKVQPKVDMVITDSQAFKEVNQIVPGEIPLTSFSILFARLKGDLSTFREGIDAIGHLRANSKILISESCTHNHSHEDIGRVKIPKLLEKHLGFKPQFDFKMGHDFSDDLSKYDLVIHCGSCMLNKKTMTTRIDLCKESKTPITNYGIILAYLNDILDESLAPFVQSLENHS